MIHKYYKYILGFILITVLATIGLQGYWNYKNYLINKNQLSKEVQLIFDQSVADYVDQVSKEDVIGFLSKNDKISTGAFIKKIRLDTIFKNDKDDAFFAEEVQENSVDSVIDKITSVELNYDEAIILSEELNKKKTHSSINNLDFQVDSQFESLAAIPAENIDSIHIEVVRGQFALDAIENINDFKNRIVISMTRDTIDYPKIDSIFNIRLKNAAIPLEFSIHHFKNDSLFESYPIRNFKMLDTLQTSMAVLKQNETMKMTYNMPKSVLFYRMGFELGLSLLLALAVLGCLLFLLKIINEQKRIDEIKNDFISNMTHEFKTPIATITTALEGMTHFNPNNDPIKNEKYLNVSNLQLQKLTQMVEKILEMASLKADQLELNFEIKNMADLVENVILKFQPQTDKTIHFGKPNQSILANVDAFYMEQVFSNLIDNAIKYGGNDIFIELKTIKMQVQIDVSDNGVGIPKASQSQIFDQFYRVPKGNVHDVKGFGIGLFFAKTITEKCEGTLILIPEPRTTFRIILPLSS